jgi:hypothetical protein
LEYCSVDRLQYVVSVDKIIHLTVKESFFDLSDHLSLYSNVRTLFLESVTLTSFSFLSSLPNLKDFHIDNNDDMIAPDYLPSQWHPFQDCTQLEYLVILSKRDSDLNLNYLFNLSNLKYLHLHFFSIQDFSFISCLKSLEEFTIITEDNHDMHPNIYRSLEHLTYASYQAEELLS